MKIVNGCFFQRLFRITAISLTIFAGGLTAGADTITTYTFDTQFFAARDNWLSVHGSGTLNISSDNPWVAAPGSFFDFGWGDPVMSANSDGPFEVYGASKVDLTGSVVAAAGGFPVVQFNGPYLELHGISDASPTSQYVADAPFHMVVGLGDWVGPFFAPPAPAPEASVPDSGSPALLLAVSLGCLALVIRTPRRQ